MPHGPVETPASPAPLPRRWGPATFWTVVFLISQVHLARMISTLDPSFFAMQFALTADEYREIIEAWGPGGVETYREHFPFDLVHPLLFAMLGWVSIRSSPLFAGYDNSPWRLVLPVAAVCDYGENLCQLKLLNDQTLDAAAIDGNFVLISGICAMIKWALAGAFVGLLVYQSVWFWRYGRSG